MLHGIDQVLTGALLAPLDAMGHSDSVVIADAHFPSARIGRRVVTVPLLDAPRVLRAVCSVLPLDDAPALDLMTSADGAVLEVQQQLLAAAGIDTPAARFLDRYDFYTAATEAFLVIRTGETRSYGNVLIRKGLVNVDGAGG